MLPPLLTREGQGDIRPGGLNPRRLRTQPLTRSVALVSGEKKSGFPARGDTECLDRIAHMLVDGRGLNPERARNLLGRFVLIDEPQTGALPLREPFEAIDIIHAFI